MKHKKSVLLAMAVMALLSGGCASKMLYHPTQEVYGVPSDQGFRYEEVTFESGDGTVLSGWFIPAVGEAKATVIQFHGNAENMTSHAAFVLWLARADFNVFVFDYRGYGASEGEPNRDGVYRDSCAALQYIRSRTDIDTERILVLGQSLGGANALAAIHSVGPHGIRAVAIDSTFYSYRTIVRDKIKQIPLLGLLRWPLSFLVISNHKSPASTLDGRRSIPLLILHGTYDAVVPYRHAKMLFERAKEPKMIISVPNGRHTSALRDPSFRIRLVNFFEKALAPRLGE